MSSSSTRDILLIENSLVKLRILRKLRNKRRRINTHVRYMSKLIYGEFHHYIGSHFTTNFQIPISVKERLLIAIS